ncbi:histamine H2 receptor-like [Dendronephthya gigantea]|uniref:histamine H2 receptor-like n=1 Tax=Dendronephthya gigantea TaxID=151771 RepID=UPI00106AAE7D|nr:histamine H2 receptor-like [Dendronephthya gigantea]
MENHLNATITFNVTPVTSLKNEIFSVGDIVHLTLYSLLFLIVIVGNTFVILAFKLNYRLRTATNIGLVSLAFSDLLVGLISIPLWIFLHISFNEKHIRPAYYHGLFLLFDVLNGSASIFQLTAICIERCFSIVAPIRHRSLPRTFHYRVVLVVWILASVCSVTSFLAFTGLIDYRWYMKSIVIICFIIPLVVMTVSYSWLFRTVRKRNSIFPTSNLSLNWTSQRKTIITILIVTGLFVIAWSPTFIFTLLLQTLSKSDLLVLNNNVHIRRIPKWMQYMNSALNPLVYAYRNNDFKTTFKRMTLSIMRCQAFQQVCRRTTS